ncbi:MFS transporter [Paenibacillus flagellatus]|uniref:MFS transporter n=1 Tax=Paenibacillus flagellatus TaxID=2211139 RepID=A0A2V5K9G3_9BACL|nr:MFS transporter [Paenibacillus flagellatus]PYI56129.1 MFS transporter [Paenibacillus flagellatus]
MEKLWTKPFVLLTVSMLFLFTSLYLLLPTMPLLVTQLGGTESQVGLAAGVFTLAAVVFRPIVGGLLDRYGRQAFIVWGLLLFGLSMIAYDWIAGIAALMALRVLHGASWAFSTTAVGTSITDVIPTGRRGEGMGWYGLAMTMAMAVGPMLGIWVVRNESFGGLFLLAAGLCAVSLLLASVAKAPYRPKPSSGRIALFEKSTLPAASAIFFLAFVYGGITTFVPLFAESIDVNPGTFFLAYAVTLTAARPLAGKLSDRYGAAFVVVPALAVTIGSLIVLSLADGLAGVVVSAVLYGLGFGSAQPALQAINLGLADPDRRGVATASYMTAFDLGIGLGSIALGWVSQYTGYPTVFQVGAGSVVVSLSIFLVLARRMAAKHRERANAAS